MKCSTFKKTAARRLTCALLLIFLLCCAGTRSLAVQGRGVVFPSYGEKLKVWADGVSVATQSNGGVTRVTLTAPNTPRIRYPYLFRTGGYDWTGYGTFAFCIENAGTAPVPVKFSLTDAAGDGYWLDDTDFALVRREGESAYEMIYPAFGLMELAPGFVWEVHIPLDSIPESALRSVVSFGVTCAVSGEYPVCIELSGERLAERSLSMEGFRVVGAEDVEIPSMGAAMARYLVDFDGETRRSAAFALESAPEGVSLTEDGVLTVEAGTRAGEALIRVSVGDVVRRGIPVKLSERGWDAGFPRPDEAARLEGANDILFDDWSLYAVRFIFAAASLFLAGVYLWWKKRYGSGSS